jgi:[acyl-carrier-protein] S-malonyltransferase
LDAGEAIALVRQRGVFMQEAIPPGVGGMAAIVGLDQNSVAEVCLEAGGPGEAEPANYNSPSQIVISGKLAAVEKAAALAREKGAKTVMLSVSGPFHSSLLEPAAQRLAEALGTVNIKTPRLPVLANVSAEPVADPTVICLNLINQVKSAVLWQQSIEKLIALGVTRFVEIGPGKVLTGLMKKIDKNAEIYNIENKDTLERVLPVLKGA